MPPPAQSLITSLGNLLQHFSARDHHPLCLAHAASVAPRAAIPRHASCRYAVVPPPRRTPTAHCYDSLVPRPLPLPHLCGTVSWPEHLHDQAPPLLGCRSPRAATATSPPAQLAPRGLHAPCCPRRAAPPRRRRQSTQASAPLAASLPALCHCLVTHSHRSARPLHAVSTCATHVRPLMASAATGDAVELWQQATASPPPTFAPPHAATRNAAERFHPQIRVLAVHPGTPQGLLSSRPPLARRCGRQQIHC